MIEANVNPGRQKDGSMDPFLVLTTRYDTTGYFSLSWNVTPAQLRKLADEMESVMKPASVAVGASANGVDS